MVKSARESIEKLVNEGKTEDEVAALKPTAELDKTWSADAAQSRNFVKWVYNSFKRS
jgi:hypothetical protein